MTNNNNNITQLPTQNLSIDVINDHDEADTLATDGRYTRAEVLLGLLEQMAEAAQRPGCHREKAVAMAVEADRLCHQILRLEPTNVEQSRFDSVGRCAYQLRQTITNVALDLVVAGVVVGVTPLHDATTTQVAAVEIGKADLLTLGFALESGAKFSWRAGWVLFATAPENFEWFGGALTDLGPVVADLGPLTNIDRIDGILDEGYDIAVAYEVATRRLDAVRARLGA